MKKIVFAVTALFSFISIAQAEIVAPHFKPTESEKEFDVVFYQPRSLTPYEVPAERQEAVSVTQAFKVTYDGCDGEILYSLFTDTGVKSKSEIALYSDVIMMNIAGSPEQFSRRGEYKDRDVARQFNGTSGVFYLVEDPESVFAAGYKYALIESFYKKGQGLCVRTFLFDSMEFVGISHSGRESVYNSDAEYFRNYETFTFMEKNAKGEFVLPKSKSK